MGYQDALLDYTSDLKPFTTISSRALLSWNNGLPTGMSVADGSLASRSHGDNFSVSLCQGPVIWAVF